MLDDREYPFEIYKDRHEITGITTQITFNGADGILLSPVIPLRTSFAEPKQSTMFIVLLGKEISVDNDIWKNYVINKYTINYIDANYSSRIITYSIVGLQQELPDHSAWAIVDSVNELKLACNTKLTVDTEDKLRLYYGIEKITL